MKPENSKEDPQAQCWKSFSVVVVPVIPFKIVPNQP